MYASTIIKQQAKQYIRFIDIGKNHKNNTYHIIGEYKNKLFMGSCHDHDCLPTFICEGSDCGHATWVGFWKTKERGRHLILILRVHHGFISTELA